MLIQYKVVNLLFSSMSMTIIKVHVNRILEFGLICCQKFIH